MSEDKEQYIESIRQLIPINELSPQLQTEVTDSANVVKYKKKQFVFKQGDKDNYSFYLLEGELELLADKEVRSKIVSGADGALYPMAQLQPRQFSAKAKTAITILQVSRATLDRLMVLEEKEKTDGILSGDSEMEVSDIGEEDSGDWMTTMLQSELFSRLPTANIHQLFALLEEVEAKAGDTIIKQGDIGDQYYIIQTGRCEVTRSPSEGAKPIKLTELGAGDSFGEEALLTDAKRNASINMLTDGLLMQLSKDNFINLIKKPTLGTVSYGKAKELIEQGASWLDVRFKNEYEESNIEGSINIPLNVLRTQTDKLDSDKQYVIYCDTGGRSSAATFLLAQRGFNVCYLEGGLVSTPEAAKAKEVSEEVKPAEDKEEEVKKEVVHDSDIDPDIHASALEADLGKTNVGLEQVKKQEKAQGAESKKEQQEIKKKLEQEQKKLQAEKKTAEKKVQKAREQEAAKIKKLKQEAERRLQEEKKKLEEVYIRNTQEMEKLQRMKKEAEEQIRKEREKLEKESEEARKKLEKVAEEKRAQQTAMEKQLQAKAKAKINEERKKLAEEVAVTSEELARMQREKAVADAARKAAEEEAQKIVAEYKEKYEKERAAEEARMQEERKKIEEDSKKIQETLKQIQDTRQDAEAAKEAAEKDAQKLRDKQQKEDDTQSRDLKKELERQIKEAESKLSQAKKNVEDAQEAEHTIVEAKEVNEQDLLRQKEEEEKLRKQVEADLAQWVKEYASFAKTEQEESVSHSEHMKRIKKRAEAAKKEAEQATDDLFSDIASQLGGGE